MKKALVIGGSSGIGLSIGRELIERGFQLIVLARHEPVDGFYPEGKIQYHKFDLLDFDQSFMEQLALDQDIEVLMITAGIGRITAFEFLSPTEIEKVMNTNATQILKILRIFYPRIKAVQPFYCGIMGSIAGLVSSPLFSVYAASKAAICRCIESINIELESQKFQNQILCVNPGMIKGTHFYGEENVPELTKNLAVEILSRLFNREAFFIPNYDEIYKDVIEFYQQRPHEYGLHSYHYKMDSGRVNNEPEMCIGYLSGTFDLFHIGHLNLIRRAKEQCDYLIVGVHESGTWKGKETFIPLEERKSIVGACKYVDKVVTSCREDSDAWVDWHYNKLFVGSDYKGTERFQKYEEYFRDKGVKIVYFPYTQSTSSTQIREAIESIREYPD